nr:hypothetical protein Iba_chr01aCG4590 [Ipomoea batatas]
MLPGIGYCCEQGDPPPTSSVAATITEKGSTASPHRCSLSERNPPLSLPVAWHRRETGEGTGCSVPLVHVVGDDVVELRCCRNEREGRRRRQEDIAAAGYSVATVDRRRRPPARRCCCCVGRDFTVALPSVAKGNEGRRGYRRLLPSTLVAKATMVQGGRMGLFSSYSPRFPLLETFPFGLDWNGLN